jgi:hypothetical protein
MPFSDASVEQKRKMGCFMKTRKMVRWQLVLAGLAAALYFAPVARSQEITNTAFPDGPNVTTFDSGEAAQPSAQVVPVQPPASLAVEASAIQASLTQKPSTLLNSPWVTAGLTILLLAGVTLSAITEYRRVRGTSRTTPRQAAYRSA